MSGLYIYQLIIVTAIYFMGVFIGRASVRIDKHMIYTEPSDADFYGEDN